MPFKEYITAKNIIFLVLLVIALKFMSKIAGIVMLFYASYVLACSLNPIVDKLEKKMKRSLATTLVLTSTFVVTTSFFLPILFLAIKETKILIASLPQKLVMLEQFIQNKQIFGQKLVDMIDFSAISGSSANIATNIVNQSVNITVGLLQFIILFVAIITIVFYFLNDKDYLSKKFIEFFPEKMKEKAETISKNISNKVGGYVIAQIISCGTIWIMVSAYLAVMKVDYALVMGLISGILDIVPVLGPTIAYLLIISVCYQMGPVAIIMATILFLVVQQISNNLIRPIVFGKFLNLHPLVIIFALFVAGQFLGALGVILAPALAATVCILLDELYIIPVNKNK